MTAFYVVTPGGSSTYSSSATDLSITHSPIALGIDEEREGGAAVVNHFLWSPTRVPLYTTSTGLDDEEENYYFVDYVINRRSRR